MPPKKRQKKNEAAANIPVDPLLGLGIRVPPNWRDAAESSTPDERIDEIIAGANEGTDGHAMYLLGTWYELGNMGFNQDSALAKTWWKKGSDIRHRGCLEILAENGETDEIFWVGHGYRWGKFGFPKDKRLALEWWKKGATKKHATCVVHLGLAAVIPDDKDDDNKSKQDPIHGVFLISQGAAMGSKTGMFLLGSINFFGSYGVPRNFHMATYWLKRVAHPRSKKGDLTDDCLERAKEILWVVEGNEDDIDKIDRLSLQLASAEMRRNYARKRNEQD